MSVHAFLSGAIAMACFAISAFFFHFYRDTKDRLFLLFGVAFSLLVINRMVLAFVSPTDERDPWFYVLRLLSFVLIAIAIVDKNRRR